MFSVVIQAIDGALSEKYSRIHTLGCFYVPLHIWYQWKMSDQVSKEAKENNLTLGFIRKEAETEGGKKMEGRKKVKDGSFTEFGGKWEK